MDSVLLLCVSALSNFKRYGRLFFGVGLSLLWLTPAHAAAKQQNNDSYLELQSAIIDLISSVDDALVFGARDLQDSDIAASLYLALYRGVKVRVILGDGSQGHADSRLPFLQKLRVPVKLIDKKKFLKMQRLGFLITSNGAVALGCLLKPRGQRCVVPNWFKLDSDERRFWLKHAGDLFAKTDFLPLATKTVPDFHSNPGNGYQYGNNKGGAKPAELAPKLPGQTIWQKRKKQKWAR